MNADREDKADQMTLLVQIAADKPGVSLMDALARVNVHVLSAECWCSPAVHEVPAA